MISKLLARQRMHIIVGRVFEAAQNSPSANTRTPCWSCAVCKGGPNSSCYCTCAMLAHKFIIALVVVVDIVKWPGHSTRVGHIAGEHSINVLSC